MSTVADDVGQSLLDRECEANGQTREIAVRGILRATSLQTAVRAATTLWLPKRTQLTGGTTIL